MSDLIAVAKNDIKKGSKSFALASFFFSQNQKEAAWKLYAWCRYCDDVIDHSANLQEAQIQVHDLIKKTEACYAMNPPTEHPWPSFSQVIHENKIPKKYPLDLLRGFQIDAMGTGIKDREELMDYCYCVAGTVGLMMCHVMGISHTKALQHAVSLGCAMQMTNIARDINDDYKMGRVYLPDTWLAEKGLNRADFFQPEFRQDLKPVVQRLMWEADSLYAEGRSGLSYLSLRSAWAVCIALHVYRDIGRQVVDQTSSENQELFQQRIIVSPKRKFVLLIKASFDILRLWPSRWFQPWKKIEHSEIWSDL